MKRGLAPAGVMAGPARVPGRGLASAVMLFSAGLWGLSWWPMQQLAAVGVAAPLLSFLAYGGAGLASLPVLWRERTAWRSRPGQMLMMALFGGWAAASFMVAMTQGDVVREMLLFYLAPAWSVLGARVLLKERVSRRRFIAVGLALVGAYLVVGAGAALGRSRFTVPDAMALSSGLSFAANNLVTRAAGTAIPVASKTSAMFLGCCLLSAGLLAMEGSMPAPLSAVAVLGVLGFALVWIIGGTSTTTYGMTHLEAGRAALLLLAELVAAVVSASLIHQRLPSVMEMAGGALILAAATLDGLEA